MMPCVMPAGWHPHPLHPHPKARMASLHDDEAPVSLHGGCQGPAYGVTGRSLQQAAVGLRRIGRALLPSWRGLSGPSVAAQVLERMARTSRAMTTEERPSLRGA